MVGGIFISYRRDYSRHAAGRLVERLEKIFPREQLFFDIDTIEPGLDFAKVISEKLKDCDVMLAVIGPNWATSRDESGALRLEDPDDFVRLELEAALKRDIRALPVLADGAKTPREDGLPDGLKPLVRRNAVSLSHERFSAEAEGLARSLASLLRPSGQVNLGADRLTQSSDSVRNDRRTLIYRIKVWGVIFMVTGAI